MRASVCSRKECAHEALDSLAVRWRRQELFPPGSDVTIVRLVEQSGSALVVASPVVYVYLVERVYIEAPKVAWFEGYDKICKGRVRFLSHERYHGSLSMEGEERKRRRNLKGSSEFGDDAYEPEEEEMVGELLGVEEFAVSSGLSEDMHGSPLLDPSAIDAIEHGNSVSLPDLFTSAEVPHLVPEQRAAAGSSTRLAPMMAFALPYLSVGDDSHLFERPLDTATEFSVADLIPPGHGAAAALGPEASAANLRGRTDVERQ
jgi:hypothetical protein